MEALADRERRWCGSGRRGRIEPADEGDEGVLEFGIVVIGVRPDAVDDLAIAVSWRVVGLVDDND